MQTLDPVILNFDNRDSVSLNSIRVLLVLEPRPVNPKVVCTTRIAANTTEPPQHRHDGQTTRQSSGKECCRSIE